MADEKSTCCTCGYSWVTGMDGSHLCSTYLLKRVKELESALHDATLHFTQKSFSTRPCPTCETVSKLIGKSFGCKKMREADNG